MDDVLFARSFAYVWFLYAGVLLLRTLSDRCCEKRVARERDRAKFAAALLCRASKGVKVLACLFWGTCVLIDVIGATCLAMAVVYNDGHVPVGMCALVLLMYVCTLREIIDLWRRVHALGNEQALYEHFMSIEGELIDAERLVRTGAAALLVAVNVH